MKLATRAQLNEHQECSQCHCHAKEGYVIKHNDLVRFVCEVCFSELTADYPLSPYSVSIDRRIIDQVVPADKKPAFQAGYFLGKKEGDGRTYTITITDYLECASSQQGSVRYFEGADVKRIRKKRLQEHLSLVGLYRTSPSGSPDFNALDHKMVDDLLMEVIYVVIGGHHEGSIAIRDKQHQTDAFGLVIV